jgi:hypothetical protein
MPLSVEEKQRIREEEVVRLQARREYRARQNWRIAALTSLV